MGELLFALLFIVTVFGRKKKKDDPHVCTEAEEDAYIAEVAKIEDCLDISEAPPMEYDDDELVYYLDVAHMFQQVGNVLQPAEETTPKIDCVWKADDQVIDAYQISAAARYLCSI